MWLALLLLQGCTYKKAMEAGVLLEASGDLSGALDQYALALAEKPGDPEATARREAVLDAQAEAALTVARACMEKADYEGAMAALADAEALNDDHPAAYAIRQRAREELQSGIQGLYIAHRYPEAYDLALRYAALFERKSWLNKVLVDLRAHYRTQAQELFVAGEHARALAALDAISSREPDQEPVQEAQRHAIVTAWADKHARIASDLLRRDQPGGAAASWIRAWEIAARPTDREAADRMLERLTSEGALGFRIDSRSATGRDRAIAEVLQSRLLALPNTRVQQRSPHLVVTLLPSPSRCTEVVQKTPKTSNFIAGTVDVPNPAWVEVDQRLVAKDAEVIGGQRKIEALWVIVGELDQRLNEHQAELVTLLGRKPGLETMVEEAKVQRDKAAELEADSLSAWEAALLERTATLEQVTERLAELEAKNAPLQEEAKGAEAQIRETQAAVQAAKAAAKALETERDALPATVERQVDDTLHWDLEDWTRTCEAELTVRLQPNWPTEQPVLRAEKGQEATTDQAHIGNAAAALDEDPKVYPLADDALLSTVDTRNLDAMLPWLEAVVTEHFHVRTTATAIQLATEPHRATSEGLRLLLGARERIDPAAVGLFDTQIRRAWDLQTPFVEVPSPPGG
ncbi:MAG: hypothetical protein H6734_24325 [Alphaproteobacteria bacterium]|nr:hypothetical protein [Alphaproteobacteria bacterium]